MTPEQRRLIREARDEQARLVVAREEQERGAEFCVRCNNRIEKTRPGQRFCSASCRKRFGDPEYRVRRRARFGAHGTAGTYKQGCRCERCRKANALAVGRQRALRRRIEAAGA